MSLVVMIARKGGGQAAETVALRPVRRTDYWPRYGHGKLSRDREKFRSKVILRLFGGLNLPQSLMDLSRWPDGYFVPER
jgi:hypothetical protein